MIPHLVLAKMPAAYAHAMFGRIDRDSDGLVTLDEFALFLHASERELLALFRAIDKNGDGCISQRELADFLVLRLTHRLLLCMDCCSNPSSSLTYFFLFLNVAAALRQRAH